MAFGNLPSIFLISDIQESNFKLNKTLYWSLIIVALEQVAPSIEISNQILKELQNIFILVGSVKKL